VIFHANHIVGHYFTFQEILRFRELQATTGAIISGSTALQFFDRTIYANSDLDLYVQHDCACDLALWLESIGYMFVPLENDNFQTLQMSLDKSPDFDPTDITFDNEYCDGVIILNFMKEDHPSIQVITSRGPPLGMVLQFHSSGFFFCSEPTYVFIQLPSRLRYEFHHPQQSLFDPPTSDLHPAAISSVRSFAQVIQSAYEIRISWLESSGISPSNRLRESILFFRKRPATRRRLQDLDNQPGPDRELARRLYEFQHMESSVFAARPSRRK